MIAITGGAGFIGSNVVHALNRRGQDDLLVVDDLTDAAKVVNIAGARLVDYLDRSRFLDGIVAADPAFDDIELVIHQGASSSTTEADGRYVVETNYEYSKQLLRWCLARSIPIVYASSAAVYGAGDRFAESPENETPLNVYGWSKLLTDNLVRRLLPTAGSQIVGLRYFNVYGPGEDHKGPMASILAQLDDEVARTGAATIFGASHGVGPGEQRRDFVDVADVIDVLLWFVDHPEVSGIFNCGTGVATTFQDVARRIVEFHGGSGVVHRPFPPELLDRYQSRTVADLTKLREVGYRREFTPVEVGLQRYLDHRRGRRRVVDRPVA